MMNSTGYYHLTPIRMDGWMVRVLLNLSMQIVSVYIIAEIV